MSKIAKVELDWFPNILPVRASCLGGMFYIVGAGGSMMGSLQFVMVADVCPAELRYEKHVGFRIWGVQLTQDRATAFAWVQSALLLAQFVFTPVGGALISQDPWIPMFICSGFMVLGLLVAMVFLPETLPLADRKSNDASELPTERSRRAKSGLQIQERLGSLANIGLWLLGNSKLSMTLLCFFFFAVGQQENSSLLLQYAYKRFNWSLGEVRCY